MATPMATPGKAPMTTRSTAPENGTDETQKNTRGRVRAAAIATTVTTAAAATVAFAAPADAHARYYVWDRVASCESSGDWHIDTGNGYYGGVQFSASTWAAYGGHKYASQADNASRLEQIEVARRVLDAQGPGAWPVCGPRAGLSRDSGDATSAPLPAHPDEFTHHARRHHRHHAKRDHHIKRRRHHAKHRHHRSRQHHVQHHRHYTVRSGDTLSKIAERFHVHGGWPALYRANHNHMSNPNYLRVGQVLVLP